MGEITGAVLMGLFIRAWEDAPSILKSPLTIPRFLDSFRKILLSSIEIVYYFAPFIGDEIGNA